MRCYGAMVLGLVVSWLQTLKAPRLTYTDSKTGRLMSQGIENPNKLASAAMSFAEKGFDKALLTTAEPEIVWRSVQGAVSQKPKALLRIPVDRLRTMPADAPATLSRHPMNCVTMKLGSDISTTNCN